MKVESLIRIAAPAAAPPEVELSLLERDRTRATLQQVFLIRHGETEWSLNGQHTGTTDVPLTEHGREMAKRLEPIFAHEQLALVLTSPLRRARTTCALAGLSERCNTDRDLREWDYGDFEGLTMNEIEARAPGWNLFRDGSPHGETPGQVAERADRVIERVRAVHGQVAVFGHGHILRVFVARWLRLDASAGEHFLLDTTTLNVLSYYRGVPAIKQWNAPLGQWATDRLEDA